MTLRNIAPDGVRGSLATSASQLSDTTAHLKHRADLAPLAAASRLFLVLTTPQGTQTIEIDDGQAVTVGRRPPADLCVADHGLSRLHARFVRAGQEVRVCDLGSRNGSWLRGQRIEQAVLLVGDAVFVGSTMVSLQSVASAVGSSFGLIERGILLDCVRERWGRAQVSGESFALLCVQPARKGARLTREAAAALASGLKAADRAAFDEGSLLVLLAESNAQSAMQKAREFAQGSSSSGPLVCGVANYPQTSSPEELLRAARQAASRASAMRPVLKAPEPPQAGVGEMVYCSPVMQELTQLIGRVAKRPITVLVHGETGVGKELVARELHQRSPRHDGPFEVVNCAAIPEQLLESVLFGHVRGAFTGADGDHRGAFAQADGGTLFLDEVGELSAAAQAALLRVLETRQLRPVGGSRDIPVNVRVIAATNCDLAALSESGKFRLDLYHRLNAVVLSVPPLRERKEEIEPLVRHFLARLAVMWCGVNHDISPSAIQLLQAYDWPGNVRELRNVIEGAVAMCDRELISPAELPVRVQRKRPPRLREEDAAPLLQDLALPACAVRAGGSSEAGSMDLRTKLHEAEATLLREALAAAQGNVRQAARLLNVPLRTLQRKLQQLEGRDAVPG